MSNCWNDWLTSHIAHGANLFIFVAYIIQCHVFFWLQHICALLRATFLMHMQFVVLACMAFIVFSRKKCIFCAQCVFSFDLSTHMHKQLFDRIFFLIENQPVSDMFYLLFDKKDDFGIVCPTKNHSAFPQNATFSQSCVRVQIHYSQPKSKTLHHSKRHAPHKMAKSAETFLYWNYDQFEDFCSKGCQNTIPGLINTCWDCHTTL